MAIPFVITEGTSLIVDVNGNLASIVPNLAGQNRLATDSTITGGRDEGQGFLQADVELKNNRHALVTSAFVSVEQVFGFDNFADTWFDINSAGLTGNTWRIQIDGYTDPTASERDVPAIDITITVTATEENDEIAIRDKIIQELNNDVDFAEWWRASNIKDNPIIHIQSRQQGEYGERKGASAWSFTTTGSANGSISDADLSEIIRRGKKNAGARDPRDKRLVTVGISGDVVAVPGAAGDIEIRPVTDDGTLTGSADLQVNGSLANPEIFQVVPPVDKDLFITELRFYGGGNGIQFGNFLSRNQPLSNGILVEIRSDEEVLQFPLLKTTEDFKNKWSFGSGSNFRLDVGSGQDQFLAVLIFENPFPLRKQGTFISGDDCVKVFIRDNLSNGLQELECYAVGFKREV